MASIFRRLWTDKASKLVELRRNVGTIADTESATIQHLRALSAEIAEIRKELALPRMRRMLDAIHQVSQLKIETELPAVQAIAAGLQAVMAPLPPPPPGAAGGIARARYAWRFDDGTFMSYDAEEAVQRDQQQRMARGGRARARGARRDERGRYVS